MSEQPTANDSLEHTKAFAEIEKLKAETELLKKSPLSKPGNWVPLILAAGGLLTAFGQYQVSEVKAEKQDLIFEQAKAKLQAELASEVKKLDAIKMEFSKLSKQKSELLEEINTLSLTSTSLRSANDQLAVKAKAAAEIGEEVGGGHTIEKLENARFSVGIYTLSTESRLEMIQKWFEDQGYTIPNATNLTGRPDWLAARSTVHYYSNSSKEKAQELADDLSEIMETSFRIGRGAGLGVPKGEEAWTFFVHYVE